MKRASEALRSAPEPREEEDKGDRLSLRRPLKKVVSLGSRAGGKLTTYRVSFPIRKRLQEVLNPNLGSPSYGE
jgi:hypothetical protein